MTPIFSRIWLMKITRQFDLRDRGRQLAQRLAHQARLQADEAVAHLALDLGRGTSAATESMTTTSTALERTSVSTISSACSPLSGWETSRSSSLTPSLRA